MSEQSHLLAVSLSLDPARLARLPFLPTYSASLRDLIKRGVNSPANYHFPLLGCHVVVDAGNGAGGFFAEQVRAGWREREPGMGDGVGMGWVGLGWVAVRWGEDIPGPDEE